MSDRSTLFTIGIEEEYQLIDPVTRELRSSITEMMERGKMILREYVKPEMMQSQVEVGTRVCHTIKEAREQLVELRSTIISLAAEHRLAIVAAGTHPFSNWASQEVTPHERYYGVLNDMQQLARQLVIFGMHVHIGIPDEELLIDTMNVIRYFLPHILTLSTSSPFWMGSDTGLKSYRTVIFDSFPRTGIPDYFTSYAEYTHYVNTMIKTGCIDDGKKIWWDVRPHPYFQTLELRICDMCTRVDEAVAIAALFQAIVARLYKLRQSNMTFRVYRSDLIRENKWRAMRFGLDGQLLDLGKGIQLPARDLLLELLDFVDEVVDELDSRNEINAIHRILAEGSSADRQLATYRQTGDLKAVVDRLIEETKEGCEVRSFNRPDWTLAR